MLIYIRCFSAWPKSPKVQVSFVKSHKCEKITIHDCKTLSLLNFTIGLNFVLCEGGVHHNNAVVFVLCSLCELSDMTVIPECLYVNFVTGKSRLRCVESNVS